MELYSYFRSSAAFRVRIALALKGVDYDYIPVNLLQANQKSPDYLAHNPQGLVPALALDDGTVLAQSTAIIEWLEETLPEPALLPASPLARAQVRSMVNSIACDAHPICNIAVTNYLKAEHGADEAGILRWYQTWMHRSFAPIEQVLATHSHPCAFGHEPGMADIYLVPQVYNARRFKVPLAPFPRLLQVVDHCMAHPAFIAAAPEQQPDFPGQASA